MFHFGKKDDNDTLQRLVKCELCDFTTTTFKNLKEHKADIHAY